MPTYTATVSIDCADIEQAQQALAERLGHDDDYTIEYRLDHLPPVFVDAIKAVDELITQMPAPRSRKVSDLIMRAGMLIDRAKKSMPPVLKLHPSIKDNFLPSYVMVEGEKFVHEGKLLDVLITARRSIDVSLIRNTDKATAHWSSIASKLDATIAAMGGAA